MPAQPVNNGHLYPHIAVLAAALKLGVPPREIHADARTPEERIQSERRELGVDHALVGGVLARRWGLPKSIASVIERHHSDDCDGEDTQS